MLVVPPVSTIRPPFTVIPVMVVLNAGRINVPVPVLIKVEEAVPCMATAPVRVDVPESSWSVPVPASKIERLIVPGLCNSSVPPPPSTTGAVAAPSAESEAACNFTPLMVVPP